MGFINVKWKGASLKQDASNRLVTDNEKTTWNNKANNSHTHTKSQVGLGNVDNTADSVKNVKYATSAGSTSNVIDVGAGSDDKSRHVWFSNTSPETSRVYSDKFQYNPATDVLTVGSITGSASSAASVPWSGITGKPSTFTPSSHTHTKSQVGLGNVDNTADSVKNVKYATSAGSATKATQDSASQQITTTYIKGLSVSGRTITYTKGDNTTGTITTQDTNTDTKVTQSAIKSSDYTNWRPIIWGSSNSANEGFAPTTVTDSVFSDPNLTYQPSSGTLRATVFKGKLSGTADVANSVAWGNVSGKPSTFTPSSHTHTKSQITDFGTYVYDATISRDANTVLAAPNGSSGVATFRKLVAADIPSLTKNKISDFPTSLPASDVYSWAKASTKPSYSKSEVGLGNVDNTADKNKSVSYANSAGTASYVPNSGEGTGNMARHVWFSNTSPETSRVYSDKFQYNPATDVLTVGSITGSAGSVAWGNVSGRPSSLPASDVYAWAKASSKPSYTWNEITSKPSTFTPSSHTHNYAGSNSAGGAANNVAAGPASVTSEAYRHVWFSDAGTETARCYNDSFKYDPKSNKLTVNISGSANSVPWSGITGKPSTFTPSSHTHTISQITNLQSVLNGKAKYDHNHDSSYIKSTGSSIIVSGTYKYINTFPNVYSLIDQESGNTPTNNRAVIWYNYEYQDNSNRYEDYCDHYLNIGSPNSGNGDETFGVIAAIRFRAAYTSGWIALRGQDTSSKQYSVYLPLNAGTLQVSSSDSKLKTNIKDTEVDDAISFINKIHLHSFDWKTDDTHQSIGFIADELEELDERLSVGGNSDKVDKNGLPIDPKCVNTFYLQGYEVKAIQELSSKVDALEKENDQLKDIIDQLLERVTTLENK